MPWRATSERRASRRRPTRDARSACSAPSRTRCKVSSWRGIRSTPRERGRYSARLPRAPPRFLVTLVSEHVLARFALAPGFSSAAVACGLKQSGTLDLVMVWSEQPSTAAGVFTTNRVQAAPVIIDRAHLTATQGRIRGVIANSGCANAVTGERGLADARYMAALAAGTLGAKREEVLVLSTGVIGEYLDMDKVARGISTLPSPLADTSGAGAAIGITTTDTVPKVASREIRLGAGPVTV